MNVASVKDGAAYRIRIGSSIASFIALAGATNDQIIAGLAAAVSALLGDNLTAAIAGSTPSTYLTLTGTPGSWDAVENFDPRLLSFEQNHSDPGLAADLSAVKLENDSWYGVICPWSSRACVLAIAAWTESNDRLYLSELADTPVEMVADAIDIGAEASTGKEFKVRGFARTAAIYHRATDAFAGAALMGKCFALNAGSETWKLKRLAGVPALRLDPTQKANLDAKNVNTFYDAGGVSISSEGKVSAGEWIDVVRGRDARWPRSRPRW